jgi:hypothetical protein
MTMQPKADQKPTTPYERLQNHVIRVRKESLKVLLDFIAPEAPATIQNIRFGKQSISMNLRLPFLLPPADDPGEYLGTVKAQVQFKERLRTFLSGPESGKHLSNALFKELKAFAVLFTGGHRWGERVLDGLNSVGEGRMPGRRSSIKIEKQEAHQILRQAQMIQPRVTEISNRAKSLKSRGQALRRKIMKDYDCDQHPWIRSLFPALQNLHGKPALNTLDPRTIRKLVAAIIRLERYRETGTSHSIGAIEQLLRRQ